MPRHPPCALLRLISNSIYRRDSPAIGSAAPVLIPHTRSVGCPTDQSSIHRLSKSRADPTAYAQPGPAKESECELESERVRATSETLSTPTRRPALLEISRKEVIQPQVPLRLPCYDFAPVTELTFGGCLLAVSPPTSGPPSFHGVTGGVYKARERIHRGVADPRLLAIPASCSRVADYNPNLDRLLAIGAPSRVGDALYRPL